MGKAAFDHTLKLTPEQRAAGAERARGLRLFGERLGLNKLRNSGVAEELKAGTALPRPQEPTQQPKAASARRAAGPSASCPTTWWSTGRSSFGVSLTSTPAGPATFGRAVCM